MKTTTTTVNVGGLAWSVISRNERSVFHEGRYFMASRCRPSSSWFLREHDQDITVHGSAKPLRVWSARFETAELSTVVREICGEHPEARFCDECYCLSAGHLDQCQHCGHTLGELHPSMTWDEHMAA